MRHNGDRSPEQIEAEIARTRAEMDATLHAIEGRLTPGQLVDQGLDYLRHSGAREFASNLGDSVKQHPLPVALVGLGVAWLIAADRLPAPRRDAVGSMDWDETGNYDSDASRGMSGTAASVTHRVSGAAASVGERVSGAAASVGERVSGAAQSARDRIGHARESIGHVAASARERAGRVSETSRRQFQRARGTYDEMLREQPLALGALGLAIGAIVAAAIPRTRQEDEMMGEARDRLAEQASTTVREQLDKAGQVAAAARDAAAEEMQRQAAEQSDTGQTQGTAQEARPAGTGAWQSSGGLGMPGQEEPDPALSQVPDPFRNPGPGR